MKFLKHSLCKYTGFSYRKGSKLLTPLALVVGPGPTPDSSIVDLYWSFSSQRNTCVSDSLLEETTEEERDEFFNRTRDMFSNKPDKNLYSKCERSRRKRVNKKWLWENTK